MRILESPCVATAQAEAGARMGDMGDRVGVQIAALVEAVPTPLPMLQKVAYEKGSAGWTEHNRVRVALREWLENRCPWPSESEYTVAEPEGASGGPGCATGTAAVNVPGPVPRCRAVPVAATEPVSGRHWHWHRRPT